MNPLFRRIIINPKNTKSHLSILKNHLTTSSQHQQQDSNQNQTTETITNILKSYPNSPNWNTLNQTLNPYNLKPPTLINKVLINLKDPPNAKKALSFFHWSSHFTKTKHQIHTYALLIHILVNAKLIKDANALIQSVLARSVTGGSSSVLLFVNCLISSYELTDSTPFVFDLVVQICAKLRMINDALDVCFCLSEHGFRLSVISYNKLLHVIQKSDKNVLVWGVYEHMIVNRTDPNDKSVGIMVSALCKEGKLQAFVDMIDRIDGKRCLPRVIVNTCLVFGMVEDGRVEDGLVLLKRMLVKNMISDSVSYSLIVYGKIRMGQLKSAWEVYDEMVKRGFEANSFVHTKFIKAYFEVGKIEDGDHLFRDMERVGLKPYDETYTCMIVGLSKFGRIDESLKLCEEMVKNGFVLSCEAFNEVVERLNGRESVRQANEMLTVLLDKGFVPDVNTYSYLIAGYGREGDVEGVLKVYYEMEYRKLSPGALVFTWLVTSLWQAGRLEESEKYFRTMKARSLVPLDSTYDALISSLRRATKVHHCS